MVQWAYSDDMNASGSGAPVSTSSTATCTHRPQPGTLYTDTGLRATLNALPADYPLEAMCARCGQPIRCESFRSPWELK